MKHSKNSIYNSTLNLTGEATITLDADERMILCEALTKCVAQETDAMPIIFLMDRLVRGE